MSVPFIDLKAQYKTIKGEVSEAIQRVLDSGQFILGPEVESLEQEIAGYCQTKFAVAVASGTDALELSLRSCGVGPGDEVITPSYSFIAAAEAIVTVGAVPVFVDIESATYTLDVSAIESKISTRTKVILPVHLYGHPCAMDPILAVAQRHSLRIIEDCAQAIGAMTGGRKVGGIGHIGCLSFYPTKNLGGYGDGGMVVTNDADIADQIRLLRGHGSRERYQHRMIGRNSRLDELQAAILRVKLRHLDSWNEARRNRALRYTQQFSKRPIPGLILPQELSGCRHVYHLYTLRTPQREAIQQRLAGLGVETQVAYPQPLTAQPALSPWIPKNCHWPSSEAICREVLSVPIYPELTAEQVDWVVETFFQALDKAG